MAQQYECKKDNGYHDHYHTIDVTKSTPITHMDLWLDNMDGEYGKKKRGLVAVYCKLSQEKELTFLISYL